MHKTLICLVFMLSSMCQAFGDTNLVSQKKAFKTKLTEKKKEAESLETPPPSLFKIVKYKSEGVGELSAYLSVKPEGDAKGAAIIWITGGFPSSGGGSYLWNDFDHSNDQSARAYRQQGITMMFPSVRGCSGNPGFQESFLGEVDDICAALAYLKKVSYVDPEKIYLGGHSTGGTLALLVAASTSEFAGVISFGPTHDPASYGAGNLTYDPTDKDEARLRAPIHYLRDIKTKTLVIEGETGNSMALRKLAASTTNKNIVFAEIPKANHFEILAPINRALARSIQKATTVNLKSYTAKAIQEIVANDKIAKREASDLQDLASARAAGISLGEQQELRYYLFSYNKKKLLNLIKEAERLGFSYLPLKSLNDSADREYYRLILLKTLIPKDLDALFLASLQASTIKGGDYQYAGWDIR